MLPGTLDAAVTPHCAYYTSEVIMTFIHVDEIGSALAIPDTASVRQINTPYYTYAVLTIIRIKIIRTLLLAMI
jgi:hypothetical protein